MKGKFLSKAVFLAAAVAMAVTGIGAVPVSAEEEDINLEEFFASAGGVKQVCLGLAHCAAITTNGDLYTWGNNMGGQLGDGTQDDNIIPQKIMSDISYISLGFF